MREDNPLIDVAMQIILHAGDARLNISDAVKAAEDSDFSKADSLMETAQENLNKAHQAQTDIVQKEMQGEDFEPCILFTHAQDHLMTVSSEMNLSKHIIELNKKINKLKQKGV